MVFFIYAMKFYLYNTLSHKKEKFRPINDKEVGLYTCGPTVYQYAHVGNLRTYIFEDVLKKTLRFFGYKVKHVMNITDVGHLVSDEDTGEDKIQREAEKQRKTAWKIARFYEKEFKKDLKKLNISEPDKWTRATEHIKEQIELIKKLEKNGYTYKISDGVYFDTLKFKNYGALLKTKSKDLAVSERITIQDKRNPEDFALWKLSPSGSKRDMEWASPWGKGFPGWHVECSAMAMKYLGEHFDIHAGGIDHIPVHHTNEIAQSEAATGKKFVNYWLHGNFLQVEGKRMGKSEGNYLTLDELEKFGFDPLDYRYLTLTAHYRSPLHFSIDALKSAANARNHLITLLQRAYQTKQKTNSKAQAAFKSEFLKAVSDDLDIPKAIAALWNYSEKISAKDLLWADQIFGLGLDKTKPLKISSAVKKLLKKREEFRAKKNWPNSDEIRGQIKNLGFLVEDSPSGPILLKAN